MSELTMNPMNQGEDDEFPTQINEFDISCHIDLQEWIQNNECRSFEQLELDINGETFRDEDGCLRYVDNWLPATDEESNKNDIREKYFSLTGCYEFPVLVPDKVTTTYHNGQSRIATIRLLADWERLWLYLANDKKDEMAEQIPLLRAAAGFFLHQKILILICSLLVYNQFFTFFCYGSAIFSNLIILVYYLVGLALYYSLYRLYVGASRRETMFDSNSISIGKERKKSICRAFIVQHNTTGVRSSFRRMVTVMWSHSVEMFHSESKVTALKSRFSRNVNHRATVKSYDQLLNIALKFLSRHCELTRD